MYVQASKKTPPSGGNKTVVEVLQPFKGFFVSKYGYCKNNVKIV